jgi:hypothetical protein
MMSTCPRQRPRLVGLVVVAAYCQLAALYTSTASAQQIRFHKTEGPVAPTGSSTPPPGAVAGACYSRPCLHGGVCTDVEVMMAPDAAFAATTPTLHSSGHRRAQVVDDPCQVLDLPSRSDAVNRACCYSAVYECTSGSHAACALECAVLLPPYLQNCATALQSLGSDGQALLASLRAMEHDQAQCTSIAYPYHQCSCPLTWSGSNCEVDDLCDGVSCGEHGSCQRGACSCEWGWLGEFCELPDECASHPCGAHGTCVRHYDNQHSCECEIGWSGNNCEVDGLCDGVSCGEHGSCQRGACSCVCGWLGEFCELPAHDHARDLDPCGAHGTCWRHRLSASTSCQCEFGWSGSKCEVDDLRQDGADGR